MATFPPPDPFDPAAPTDAPALTTPEVPPEVGFGSPWAPANGENRDRILDWWRSWFTNVFFTWTATWSTWWLTQWQTLATYLNTWITDASTYIETNAIQGEPGPNTVPTDTAIAGLIATPSETQTAFDAQLTDQITTASAAQTALDNRVATKGVDPTAVIGTAFDNRFAGRKRQMRTDIPILTEVHHPVTPYPPDVVRSASLGSATAVPNPVVLDLKTTNQVRRIHGSFSTIDTDYLTPIVDGDHSSVMAIEFVTDSEYFDWSYEGTVNPLHRLIIDGRRVTADMWAPSSGGGSFFRMAVKHTTRRMRHYRLETKNMYVSFLTVGVTDTVYAPHGGAVRSAWVGDSQMETGYQDGIAGTAARLLGWEYSILALGASGYTTPTLAYIDRLADVVAYNPDVVVVQGSTNEPTTSDAIRTAANAFYAALIAALPHVRIFVVGPLAVYGDASAILKGAQISDACTDSDVPYIDPLTPAWVTGTGTVAVPAGDGNSDVYMTAGGTHLTQEGLIYWGTRLAANIANVVES